MFTLLRNAYESSALSPTVSACHMLLMYFIKAYQRN